jgi:cobalt-zinc-cadmium efflux system protein
LLTAGFAVVEAISGWLAGSLALLSDAAHMVTDAGALAIGAAAARLADRPPSLRHSYGLQRAEVVGALVNAAFMLAVIAWIAFEAVSRLLQPQPVQGPAVLLVAALGLLINLLVLRVLHGGEDLNTRAARLHVLGDLLGSVAALTAGLVITISGWTPVDPILSLLISGLILVSTTRLLREALSVVLEGVPGHLSLSDIGESLAALEGVKEVHDLHVWTLASGNYALSAHVRLQRLEEWPALLARATVLLRERFGIEHLTIQPELREAVTYLSADVLRSQR